MWNRTLQEATLELVASGINAQLISLDGTSVIAPGASGTYTITLPPAEDDTDLSGSPEGGPAIGGPPFILIQFGGGEIDPAKVDLTDLQDLESQQVEQRPFLHAAPRPPPIRSGHDSAHRLCAATVRVAVTFVVSWGGADNGIASYLIWVRVAAASGIQLNTLDTSATCRVARQYL
jgi:hypothetical protein